jgi:hypothetical protein
VAADRLALARDCLDDRLIARGGVPIGRVDGIVLSLVPGHAPRLVAIEVGASVQARRFGGWAVAAVAWLSRLVGQASVQPWRIPWARLRFDGGDCHVDVDGRSAPSRGWERWAARLLRKVPGNE